MKNTIKAISSVLVVAALLALALLTIPATAADNLRDNYNPILKYTAGNGYYYSTTGTNDSLGYTNTAKIIDVRDGTTVNFMLHQACAGVNTQTTVLVIKSAYSTAANDIATPTVALGNQVWRITLAAPTTAGNTITTNLTGVGSPYLMVAWETLPDVGSVTNVTLQYNTKTP